MQSLHRCPSPTCISGTLFTTHDASSWRGTPKWLGGLMDLNFNIPRCQLLVFEKIWLWAMVGRSVELKLWAKMILQLMTKHQPLSWCGSRQQREPQIDRTEPTTNRVIHKVSPLVELSKQREVKYLIFNEEEPIARLDIYIVKAIVRFMYLAKKKIRHLGILAFHPNLVE